MDAVKFLVECHNYCEDCRAKAKDEPPRYHRCFGCYFDGLVGSYPQKSAEKVVAMIEQILEEKKAKIKTKQDKYLESFPNARIFDGRLNICPLDLDSNFDCYGYWTTDKNCRSCKKRYWNEPVEEDK